MKNKFVFTKKSYGQLQSLEKKDLLRIKQKLTGLTGHPDLFLLLIQLKGYEPATHRLRVGDLRLILQYQGQKSGLRIFLVIKIAHRRDIYS